MSKLTLQPVQVRNSLVGVWAVPALLEHCQSRLMQSRQRHF